MDPERFQRLEELFHDIVDLPIDERDQRLARLRAEDPELAAQLLLMIARESDASAGGILRTGAGVEVPSARIDRPTSIGPFRLMRRLGEGGMGVVYEAEQEVPFRRRVALKLIRHGLGSDAVVARFRLESQALALMDHPNIARVFDAGSSEDGRPYFVMELVEGPPITHFCDQRRLSTAQRLRLFLDVCDAVQHAHRRGVLHRDLKPSNLLVQEDDGEARVKVIDFGVARALDHAQLGREQFTRHGELVGTPEYMSPEQAAGQDLDTRSDVYSLGVVLHELLIGELPLPAEVLRSAGFDEIRRQIREYETPRPSTRAGSGGPASADLASRRGTDPGRLARQLRGDLDWIVLKALTKEPDRRYESPNDLKTDLERHLEGEPVLAGPPSLRYRLAKFARRHRWAMAAATLFTAATLVALGGLVVGFVRARAAEETALEARAAAEQEAQVANEISDFLVDLFAVSDPRQSSEAPVTAREILDRGVERIRTELVDRAAVRARLLQEMGRVYGKLGAYEEARPLLEEAVELRRAQVGMEKELAAALHSLGYFQYTFLEEIAPSRASLEEAVAIGEASEVERSELARYLNDLAMVLSRSQEFEPARAYYTRALELLEGSEDDTQSRAEIESNLAVMAQYQGDHSTAIEHLERSLSLLEGLHGPDHPDVGLVSGNLAFSLLRSGRPTRALAYYDRDLAIGRRAYGDAHPFVATTVYQQGQALEALGRYDEAASHYERALEIFSSALGPDHYRATDLLAERGKLAMMRGDFSSARTDLAAADARYAASDHPVSRVARVRVLEWFAQLERFEGRPDVAAEHCREAMREAATLAQERQASEQANCRLQLALLALESGDEATAGRSAREAESAGGRSLDDVAGAYSLAAWRARAGDFDAAFELLRRSLEEGYAHAWAAENPDLGVLHADPRMTAWVTELEDRLREP